jgi:hypothetical protein
MVGRGSGESNAPTLCVAPAEERRSGDCADRVPGITTELQFDQIAIPFIIDAHFAYPIGFACIPTTRIVQHKVMRIT